MTFGQILELFYLFSAVGCAHALYGERNQPQNKDLSALTYLSYSVIYCLIPGFNSFIAISELVLGFTPKTTNRRAAQNQTETKEPSEHKSSSYKDDDK